LAKGQPFEIISDIGSRIDYKKKGLQELIRRISQDQVEKVVVLYKDRLLRFGFELINISLHFIIVRLRVLIILKNPNSRNLLKIWFR
jgi:predicted site-specific integrase-resolvase